MPRVVFLVSSMVAAGCGSGALGSADGGSTGGSGGAPTTTLVPDSLAWADDTQTRLLVSGSYRNNDQPPLVASGGTEVEPLLGDCVDVCMPGERRGFIASVNLGESRAGLARRAFARLPRHGRIESAHRSTATPVGPGPRYSSTGPTEITRRRIVRSY